MVSQFVSSHDVVLLSHLNFNFPEGIHAIGRLDNLSEGLLILTTNKRVTKLLFQGTKPHTRTYWVRVKNEVTEIALQKLRTGVAISASHNGVYQTAPCEVEIIPTPNFLPLITAPAKEYYPHTWLQISLTEGKFHQVRKMVAAVGHPCKRLVRIAIEALTLGNLGAGEVHELEEDVFFNLLQIEYNAAK